MSAITQKHLHEHTVPGKVTQLKFECPTWTIIRFLYAELAAIHPFRSVVVVGNFVLPLGFNLYVYMSIR